MSTLSAGLIALLWLDARAPAYAHPAPGSVAMIDFTVDGARLEQNVPIDELERALDQPLAREGESAQSSVARHAQLLRSYAAQHVRATSDAGEAWTTQVASVEGVSADDGPRALFRWVLHAPAHAAASITLHDDMVAREVVSHYIPVYVRSDWAAGDGASSPHLVGTVHSGLSDVRIARDGSFARGLASVIALGMEHIQSGTDHLMFLFALLLVAPLAAVGGRWAERRSTRAALSALARVVTAFTLGHSLTLALGTLGGVTLPSAPVEAGIALSIAITAVHALRPLLPRGEPLMAAGFGLVHGLAFASSLPQRDLGAAQAAWTLFGFNLGIELAQLELLCAVVPWFLLLARTRAYDPFRRAGACVAIALSLAWLAERTLGLNNPFARPIGWLEAHPLQLLFALAITALLARVTERRRSLPETRYQG